MSSPPRKSIININIAGPTSPKRSSGARVSRRTPRRSTTMPSLPSPRLSGVVTPRLSKLLGDMNKFLDDNSTSATSFLSESFMNMSLSNHSHSGSGMSGGSGYFSSGGRSSGSVRRRRYSPTDICVEDFDDFVSKTLPEFVKDKDLCARLQYGVQHYLPSACPSALAEIEHYLTTILESTSLPAPVVADLHSYRGLIYLKQGGHHSAAVESFTRALWLQSHLMRLASDEQEEMERLLDMALTEHRLGVAYGRNKQYLEAIDQMKYAIQSYERAQVGISEACYACAKEDLHEFTEARQLCLLKNSGRAMRRSQLRRCKSISDEKENPLRRCKSDQTTRGARRPREEEPEPEENVPVEVELSREDSFAY